MSIADAILTQIRQAGQPRTITQKETVTGKEPIDIGGLGLLLYMMMEMQKGMKLPTEPAGGVIPPSGPMAGLQGMGGMPSFGAPAQAQGFGAMDPMQLIMAILGGGGAAGGGLGLGGF